MKHGARHRGKGRSDELLMAEKVGVVCYCVGRYLGRQA